MIKIKNQKNKRKNENEKNENEKNENDKEMYKTDALNQTSCGGESGKHWNLVQDP